MTNLLSYLITALLIAQSLYATPTTNRLERDGITVETSLDPTSCKVGDIITVQIIALTENNLKLSLAVTESVGSFTILEQHNLLDIPEGTKRKWIWTIQLDTFDAAVSSLEGITIKWLNENGEEGLVTLDPILVQVESVAGVSLDEMELRDIKGIVPLVHSRFWIMGVGTLLFLVFTVWLIWKSTRKPVIPIPAHTQALQEIEVLRNAHLPTSPFYTMLSRIVRKYIEARFDIAATEQTTNEFLCAAKLHPHLALHDQQHLGTFLTTADLVKFAKHEPSDRVCNTAIEKATTFIQSTAPQSGQLQSNNLQSKKVV